jgi:hypothetical protein
MVNELLIAHAPVAPARLHARVQALAPAPRSRARRAAYLALPVAAGLAAAAAVVHGVVGSGSSSQPNIHIRAANGSAVAVPAAPVQTLTTATASGGLHQDKAFVPGTLGRLQRTAVTLSVRVADAQAATTKAVRIATSAGGYAQSVQYDSSRHSSQLILRVPTANARSVAARLLALGTLVSQQLSVSDLEQQLRTQIAQIVQLRRTIAALQKAVDDPSLPAAQKVLLRIRLAEAKRSLSQRIHARGGTIAAGTNASIALTLTTKHSTGIAVPHHRGRLGRMLHSALGFLALEGMIALYALIAVGPFALVAIGAWMLARVRRRRLVGDLME